MTKIPCWHDDEGRIRTSPLDDHVRIPIGKTVTVAGFLEQPGRHEWSFPIPPLLTAALHPEEVDAMRGLQPEIRRYRLREHGIRVWRLARVSRCEECERIIEHGTWITITYRTLELDEDHARAAARREAHQ